MSSSRRPTPERIPNVPAQDGQATGDAFPIRSRKRKLALVGGRRELKWIYGIKSGDLIKIGVANNLDNRLREMRLLNPHPVRVVLKRRVPNAFIIEREMHRILAEFAIGREWFKVDTRQASKAFDQAFSEMLARWRDRTDQWDDALRKSGQSPR